MHKLLCLFLLINFAECESPRWDLMSQNDYTVSAHRISVDWHNETYLDIEKFEFVKHNRTFRRVFNASLYLHKELGMQVAMSVQLYKFLSNTYRFFPFTATFQVCQEYERNSFRMRDILKNYSNLDICPQKPGHLYAVNLRSDPRRLPPLIPTGDYKFSGVLYNDEDKVIAIDIYFAIIYNKTHLF